MHRFIDSKGIDHSERILQLENDMVALKIAYENESIDYTEYRDRLRNFHDEYDYITDICKEN